MSEEIRKSYYAIIPADVRYDSELSANAKLLYGEITALCSEAGYCWASNNYFAELYQVTKKSVSNWLQQLEDKGYISRSLIRDGNTVLERRIYLTPAKDEEKIVEKNEDIESEKEKISSPAIENNFPTYRKDFPYPIENNFPNLGKKSSLPREKKFAYNNTSNNTENNTLNITSNNKERAKKKETVDDVIKGYAQDDIEMLEALNGFKEMRSTIKATLTVRAIKQILNKLNSMSLDRDTQIRIIDQSTMNSWKGIFPLKVDYKNKSNGDNFDDMLKDWMREGASYG